MLSEALRDLTALAFPVESAMRLAMGNRMSPDSWVELFGALHASGHSAVLGLPDPLPPQVQDAAEALQVRPELLAVLRAAVDAPEVPDLEAAIVALTRASRLMSEPLVHVLGHEAAETGVVTHLRVLTGTGWPPVVRREHPHEPPAPGLAFLTEDGLLPVPGWLAARDDASGRMVLFAGRDRTTGRWGYLTRHPPGGLEEREHPTGTLPVFLAEPTWGTPAPARRRSHDSARDANVTQSMVLPRVSLPPVAADAARGSRTILRVVSGRHLMRYVGLAPDTTVIVGRSTGFATFPVQHHQISRSHARVRAAADGRIFVQDLKSANGTTVLRAARDGAPPREIPVGTDAEVEVQRGEVISVGPVLLRVEGVSPDQEARLARITRLREDAAARDATQDVRRDPLTAMLVPRHLVEELPEPLRAGFSAGGSPASPTLWGVLLYVDRLSAIHAQHGEQLADEIFHNVARLVQYAVDHPERCVRVGYGELMIPLIDTDSAGAYLAAEQLVEVAQGHVWPAPVAAAGAVTLTASIACKHPDEPAQEWLQRARATLQAGRSKHGRGQVYVSED